MSVQVSVEEQDASKPRAKCRTGPNQSSAHRMWLVPPPAAATTPSESEMFLHTLLSSLELQASYFNSPTRSDMVLTTPTSAYYLMYILTLVVHIADICSCPPCKQDRAFPKHGVRETQVPYAP